MTSIESKKSWGLSRVAFLYAVWTLLLMIPASAVLGQDGGPAALTIHAIQATASQAGLLDGVSEAWDVPDSPIHLNRTPPLFETDLPDDGDRPTTRVQVQRRDTLLYVKLTWDDQTIDSIRTTQAYADAGDPHIYKQQSEIINRFPDAACIMVPSSVPQNGVYPALMMGDETDPVNLYYWRAGEGFSVLRAAGRETTTNTGATFPGHANRGYKTWSVIFVIPAMGDLTPMAFGIWDGAKDHRDGIKYYSLWYDVL